MKTKLTPKQKWRLRMALALTAAFALLLLAGRSTYQAAQEAKYAFIHAPPEQSAPSLAER